MKWILRVYSFALLGYTGYRTWHFMTQQLPAGDLSNILALFFLGASEVGLILWHEVSIGHVTTREQSHTATALIVIDFLGSLGAGIGDMILSQSIYKGYTIPPMLALILLYGLPVLVGLNVAGWLYYERSDAEHQLDAAKKALKFEITRQALRELRNDQSVVAESLKKDIARQLRDEVTGRVIRQYLKPGQAEQTPQLTHPTSNGHKPPMVQYNSDTEAAGVPPLASSNHQEDGAR